MSTTQRDLIVRRRTLWIITAAVTAMAMWAYWGVHGPTAPLRRSTAPAVLAVDTARDALVAAQRDAQAGPAGAGDVQTQLSVAGQSLSQAAIANVTGLPGRQTLRILAGLVSVYTGWVDAAENQPANSVLRDAYLSYASSVLAGQTTGILTRLDELQGDQRAAVREQTSFDWTLWVRWILCGLLCAALLVRLAEAQSYLRARFRRRYNAWLLAIMLVVVAGFPVLAVLTWQTHGALAHAQVLLRQPWSVKLIHRTTTAVDGCLRRTIWRSTAFWGIPPAGAAMALAVRAGFQARLNDYGNPSRRGES